MELFFASEIDAGTVRLDGCGAALLTFAFETAAKGFAMTAYPDRAAKAIGILAQKNNLFALFLMDQRQVVYDLIIPYFILQ